MRLAIGFAGLTGQTTEIEIIRRRVADRPFAGPFRQLQQIQLSRLFLDGGQRLGGALLVLQHRRGRRRGFAPCGGGLDRLRRRRGFRLRRGRGLGGGLRRRFGRFGVGGGGRRLCRSPVRKAQPVHLADHCVAGDAAKLFRDLAGALALRPHRLQLFDPIVCPGHVILRLRAMARR